MKKTIHKVNGKPTSLLLTISEFLQNPWIKHLALPVLFLAPASLIFLYLVEGSAKEIIDRVLPEPIRDFATAYSTVLFFGALSLHAISNSLPQFIQDTLDNSKALGAEDALSLIESFQSIVINKTKRFETEYERIKHNGAPADLKDVFEAITKPDQQLLFITSALKTWLELITTDIEFEVVIVESDGKEPQQIYTHLSEDLNDGVIVEALEHPNSTVNHCIKVKDLIVISDIQKECKKPFNQRYHMLSEDDRGSVLCYPIHHKGSKFHPYILSIKASKPNYFSTKRTGLYKWFLKQYSSRIILEHNLRLLKGDC